MTGRGGRRRLIAGLVGAAVLTACGSTDPAAKAGPVAKAEPAAASDQGRLALYSSHWTALAETGGGKSLPHGAKVVLPATAESFARGLYLLQSAHLVRLDHPAAGSGPADLTITVADIVESPRHLRLLALSSDEHLPEIYQQYDAMVLGPHQATTLGLDPATDALAVEAPAAAVEAPAAEGESSP